MPNLTMWLLVAIGIAVGGFAFGSKVTADRLNLKMTNERLTWSQAVAAGQKANEYAMADAERKNLEATNERAKNNAYVDDLFAGLSGVRVSVPTCNLSAGTSSGVTESGAGETSATSGALHIRSQEALDRFKQGMDRLITEADRVIEECRAIAR